MHGHARIEKIAYINLRQAGPSPLEFNELQMHIQAAAHSSLIQEYSRCRLARSWSHLRDT